METRTTVFKKTNETYMLKMKASRALFTEVSSKCGTMPFSLRNLEDEKKARMGVVECVSHKLLEPFHVLYEKPCKILICRQTRFSSVLAYSLCLLFPTSVRRVCISRIGGAIQVYGPSDAQWSTEDHWRRV